MTQQEDPKNILTDIVVALGLTLLILLFLIFSGCRSQRSVVLTEYRDRVIHDTIVRVDSAYRVDSIVDREKTLALGDTVYIERLIEKWRTEYKDRVVEKVVDRYIHDSVPYAVEVVKEVSVVPGYYKWCSWLLWLIVIACVARIIWKLRGRWLRG